MTLPVCEATSLDIVGPERHAAGLWKTRIIRHSDLGGSCAILALNICVLASKIFASLPQVVGRSALVALNYVGLVGLNVQVRCLVKTFSDVFWASDAHDFGAMGITIGKVVNEVSNILLILGNVVAAVASLANRRIVALTLYRVMAPWGLIATFLVVGLDIGRYYFHRALSNRLRVLGELNDADERIRTLCSLLAKKHVNATSSYDQRLAATVVLSLDVETWSKLQTEIGKVHQKEQRQRLYRAITDYCRDQEKLASADLGLKGFGYFSMGVCRAFPDSLVQSGLCTAISLLYTSKLAVQKWCEARIHTQLAIPKIKVLT